MKCWWNKGIGFVGFEWDKEQQEINYFCISEYHEADESYVNFSERCGKLPLDGTIFDWFYNDAFQNDGYLVDTKHYDSIYDLMLNECYRAFDYTKNSLRIEGNTEEIRNLPSGIYFIFKKEDNRNESKDKRA